MKVNKKLRKKLIRIRKSKTVNKIPHNFIMISLCALLALSISIGSKFLEDDSHNRVYAASESDSETKNDSDSLSLRIAGSVTGALSLNSEGTCVRRIGTSCEKVMVGQRVKRVEGQTSKLSVSESMETSVNLLDSTLTEQSKSAKLMSDTDYNTLMRIVEAEAGTEDIKGRILVANVILNRVENDAFPDTVTEVVWDQANGVAQFSPTLDGRIGEVTVTEKTREAVKQALQGVDYSNGALFFIERKAASKSSLSWFDSELEFLFKYGVHEFYKYPDSSASDSSASDSSNDQTGQEDQTSQETSETSSEQTDAQEEDIVQMVKNG